ncbi:unnamed protein product [Natator depressus]
MATRWGVCSAGKISHDFLVALGTLPATEHQAPRAALLTPRSPHPLRSMAPPPWRRLCNPSAPAGSRAEHRGKHGPQKYYSKFPFRHAIHQYDRRYIMAGKCCIQNCIKRNHG